MFPITEGMHVGNILDGTTCHNLLYPRSSKLFMSKKNYLRNKYHIIDQSLAVK